MEGNIQTKIQQREKDLALMETLASHEHFSSSCHNLKMEQTTGGFHFVLLGRTGAGKSASGNTILGREAFKSKKSSRSVTQDVSVESGTVNGFPVNVYDTPGLFDTEKSEQEIEQKCVEVLQRCESDPCVFLLVIKTDRFTEEERKTVEKIEKLLGEERLKKTWILFTRGDELEKENMTIDEFLDDTEPLKRLVQKYDQRYHVFNNIKENKLQAEMLLAKIIKSYMDTEEDAEKNPLRRKIPANIEADAPVSSLSSRRIVLLGKTGVGKSASGNTILGQREFISVIRTRSVTRECSAAHATVSGRSVSVVDTPGFFDTQMKPEELVTQIARSVYISSPGPHAFLIVFPVNNRFTDQEQQIPQMIEMMFGEEVLKYSIILFTRGDQLDGESVEELIEESSRLRDLVDQCGGRYHVFNNRDLNNRDQVNDLLKKIDSMIEENGGGHYSNQMYEDAQRFRREEEEQKQREEEQKKQQEEKQRLDEEKRRQEEIERMVKEKIRAEMEAELKTEQERLVVKRQREDEERKQKEKLRREETERVIKMTGDRIRAEMEALENKIKEEKDGASSENKKDETGFLKFLSKYWPCILKVLALGELGGGVVGGVVGAAKCGVTLFGVGVGFGVGALVGFGGGALVGFGGGALYCYIKELKAEKKQQEEKQRQDEEKRRQQEEIDRMRKEVEDMEAAEKEAQLNFEKESKEIKRQREDEDRKQEKQRRDEIERVLK